MKIKTKLLFSFGILMTVVLLLGFLGSYFTLTLRNDAATILKNNSLSLRYMHKAHKELDELSKKIETGKITHLETNLQELEQLLKKEKTNLTEPGERQLAQNLETELNNLENALKSPSLENAIPYIYKSKEIISNIYELNESRIFEKNEKVIANATNVFWFMFILSISIGILAVVFTYKMPVYLTRPFQKFKYAIDQISRGVYAIDLQVNRKDEFGDLANSFKLMATRLKEFEQSNYSKILFEKKRLDTIIDQLSEAVLGLDENKHVLFANKKMLSLLNMDNKEMEGAFASDIAKHNKLMENLIREIMVGTDSGSYEGLSPVAITMVNKEQLFSKKIVDVTLSPTGQERKLLAGHVIILSDVTDFVDREKAKTHFIATLSHELKTPVAAIEMSVKLLHNIKSGELTKNQNELIRTIENNNLRIQRSINEVLDMSKIESGNIDVILSEEDVENLVGKAIDGVRLFLNDKNLTINKSIQPYLPKIKVDAHKTVWILNNFLTNAIRYAPINSVIEIKVETEESGVKISVTDSGPGIAHQHQRKIFQKFTRLVQSDTSGTGLGLPISKEFIEAMGGEIGVISKEGQGATFWIECLGA